MKYGALVVLLLAAIVAGCTFVDRSRPSAPGDFSFPAKNPSPKQIVEIHAEIAPTLDVKLEVQWRASNESCQWTRPLDAPDIAYWFWNPLEFERKGDTFNTSFAVDEYLPGRCGWYLDNVSRRISRGARTSLRNVLIYNRADEVTDAWYSNTYSTPITLTCYFLSNPASDLSWGPNCNPLIELRQKSAAHLTESTRRIDVVIRDGGDVENFGAAAIKAAKPPK